MHLVGSLYNMDLCCTETQTHTKKLGVVRLLSSRDVEGSFILSCCQRNIMHEQHLNSNSLRLSSRWAHRKGLRYWSTVDFAWNVFRNLVHKDLAVFTHFCARYCNEEWRHRLIAPWLDHLVWTDVRVFNYGQRISSRAVSRPTVWMKLNPLNPAGCYMYHKVYHSAILCSAHTVYLCVLCGSQNKHRLYSYTTLTDWFI